MLHAPRRAPRRGRFPSAALSLRPLVAAVLAATALGIPAAEAPAPWVPPAAGPMEETIAKVVTFMISRLHYERRPVDDAMSEKLYEAYFSRLDPERSYFLAADLEEFGHFRDILDELLKGGKPEFAYRVYERFVQRVRERLAFVRTAVAEPMDFTLDDTLELDRAKAPWCADRDALDALWRLRVKNQLLTYTLMDEAQQAGAETKSEETPPPPPAPPPAGETAPPAPPPPPAPKPPAERVVQYYERLLRVLEENEGMDVLEMYLSSLTEQYDPHSTYMAPTSQEEFDISMRLSLQGIGAVLNAEDGYVKIVELVPGGPADLDGRLQEGDRIVTVAQEGQEPVDVINMPLTKVVRMIRGTKGTRVLLGVLPAEKGLNSLPVTIDLRRDEVKLVDYEAKCEYRDLPATPAGAPPAAGQVAVIGLPSFYSDFEGRRNGDKEFKSASRDVRRLLNEARAAGAAGVVLDLRSDGGGSLDEAVAVAGLFFAEGPVVQVRTADRQVRVQSDPDKDTVWSGPLVVLVNRLSASASEIVAAALQDYGRAVILGDASTHGKGTVQTVYHLDSAFPKSMLEAGRKPGSLKFTVAKFYRVNGGSTQQKGVVSDLVFPAFTDYMELGERELPTALAYDEIEALQVPAVPADVRPQLEPLRALSRARTEQDPDFQRLSRNVARYGELKQAKTLTLNKARRQALQKEEDAFSEEIKRTTPGRRSRAAKPDDKKDEPVRDLLLDEAVRVIGDLMALRQKAPDPATPAVAASTPAGAPVPAATP